MIWPPNTPQLVSLYTQQASDTFFLRPPLLKKVAPGGTPLPLGGGGTKINVPTLKNTLFV